MKKIKIIGVLLISLLASFSYGQVSIETLKDSLSSYLEKKHIPGAMISIVTKDTILFSDGIGYANIQKKKKSLLSTFLDKVLYPNLSPH